MEEMSNSAIIEEQSVQTENPAAEADDWDDIDLSDVTDNDAPGQEEAENENAEAEAESDADQQSEKAEEGAPAETEEPQEGQAEADQLFELKHLGTVSQVGREEVIVLAQKGMDYDRIKSERDSADEELNSFGGAENIRRLQEMESFLKELAAPMGGDIQALMDSTRARVMADRTGVSHEVALERVKLDRERRAFEAEKQKGASAEAAKNAEEQRRKDSFAKFSRQYAEVEPNTIPNEVWDEFHAGADLSDAYARHENRLMKQEIKTLRERAEAAERNALNRQRAVGSQKSAGQGEKKDLLDDMWYDGT